jgi:hypothetical protein
VFQSRHGFCSVHRHPDPEVGENPRVQTSVKLVLAPLLLALVLSLALAASAAAQQEDPAPEDETGEEQPPATPPVEEPAAAPPEEAEVEVVQEPVEEPAAEAADETGDAGDPPPGDGSDICAVPVDGEEPMLDRVRRELFETVCNSARRFDGFFGSRRYDEEAVRTHGRAQVRLVWDEHDELEADLRFRARYNLPNLDQRVDAFFGRDDEDDLVRGIDQGFTFLPDFFRGEGRQEWILGLGYRPVGGDRRQTDFDVGVELRTPIEPFVRGRYRQYWLIGDRNLLRFQESIYWTSQRGAGGTTHVDFERPVGDQALVRWGNRGTLDEASKGVEWFTGVTYYQGFGQNQAVALSIGAEGATDHAVPLHEYGSRLTYRRRMLRDWFFGELIGGVSWPRDHRGQDRDAALHFGFGFEIQFSGEDLGVGRNRASAP